MGSLRRFLFVSLNAAWGISIGTSAGLLLHRADAWSGGPSGALLAAGCVVIFGAAYVATAGARGQCPTVLGAGTVGLSAVAVVGLWTLAVSAPGWVLIWALAGIAGLAVGLAGPLPRAVSQPRPSTAPAQGQPVLRPRRRRARRVTEGA